MPTITERKLISLGGSSLLVVLPKAWVDYHRLRRGDKVEVITNGGLRVRLKRRSPKDLYESDE
jgi:bifunctional DNA-binding transcriptional regulator/antitoxin component of YhaV-PrlF toxin-antitoxin module